MDCRIIERVDVWKNHIEPLDPVCATNTGNAKDAARLAGDAKARLVLNQAKADLAGRIQCGGGTCQRAGLICVQPLIRDIRASNGSLVIEVARVNPQPDPNPCEGRQRQYSAKAVIGFTITAKCKCERPAPENPNFFRKGPPEKAQKRKTRKYATKKSVE